MLSKVFLPIIMGWPFVSARKRFRSSGICQSSLLSFPNSRFLPIATTATILGLSDMVFPVPILNYIVKYRNLGYLQSREIFLEFFDIATEDQFHLLRLFLAAFFDDILAMPPAPARLDGVREFFEDDLAESLARMKLDDLRAGVVADGQSERPFVATIDDAREVDGEPLPIDR